MPVFFKRVGQVCVEKEKTVAGMRWAFLLKTDFVNFFYA